jgi:pimeloyl-ACP methyl ester carboxylesterase
MCLQSYRTTGQVYDILAFDPRGTGDTIPIPCPDAPIAGTTAFTNDDKSNSAMEELWAGMGNEAV